MKVFQEILCQMFKVSAEQLELKGHPIPCRIHRIWIGGGMPDHTFKNLKAFQFQLTERKSPYCHILWTDMQSLKKEKLTDKQILLVEQLKILRQLGMEIKDVSTFFPPSLFKKKGTVAQAREMLVEFISQGEIPAYKAASDILRLLILYQEGGIYMDADIGIGNEPFDEPIYHRYRFRSIPGGGYLPLIGSVSPYADLHSASDFNPESYIEAEVSAFVKKQSYGWNYFYASVAENPYVEELLATLLIRDAQTQSARIADDLYLDLYGTSTDPDIMALFHYAFAPLFLQYCTEASVDKTGE